ncbi:MAG: glycosyltransferase family 39 protein [Anaerolineales bacterium]|nr:glycosyltransferase family 39 protein [Anaerolineales bacterium]
MSASVEKQEEIAGGRWLSASGLALLLLVAAWLRLGWVGISSFSFDEARVSDMALQMARDGEFAALGMQSSAGVPNFPAAVWLYAIPFALTTNPQLAIWLTGLVNVAGVAVLWWLARRLWGELPALVAGGLMAVSPFLVFYSRSVWSQNWLAPLAVFWAATAYLGVTAAPGRRRFFWLAVHIFLAGFVGQVHIAGFALVLASVWLIFVYRLWRDLPALLVGGLLAALLMVPTIYLIACCGEGAKAELAALLEQPSHWDGAVLGQLWQLATGRDGTLFWLGRGYGWPAYVGWLPAGLTLLLLAGLLWSGWALLAPHRAAPLAPASPDWRFLTFILAWAVCGLLLFMRGKAPAQIHYQLVALPALWLLAAGLFTAHRWLRWLALLLALLLVAQLTLSVRALNLVETELVPGGMGTPLRYPQAAVDALKASGRPLVTETVGSNTAFDGDAAFFDILLRGYPHQLADGQTALLLPDEPAELLFTFTNVPAYQIAASLGLATAPQQFPRRANEPPYVALTVSAPGQLLTAFDPIEPVTLANGATLLGWRLEPVNDGARLRLLTFWQISEPPVDGHFQQFNHLYLVGGTEPAAVSDVYTSSRAWAQGDYLVTWAEFDRPAGAIDHFDVGMYSWPDLTRSSWQLDPSLNLITLVVPE